MKFLVLILFGLHLMFSVPGVWAECSRFQGCDLLEDMRRSIVDTKMSAHEAVQMLYSSRRGWDCFLKRVGKADHTWLQIAASLYSGADAGTKEMLGLAFGEGLSHDPVHVLRTVYPVVNLQKVCGVPDIDDNRFDSYENAVREIERRIDAVRKADDPSIGKVRRDCLQILEASKGRIAVFFERK